MTKRQFEDWRGRKRLTDKGWDVQKKDAIKFNSGSETTKHLMCKTLVGQYLKQAKGYRIDSEVTHEKRGEIDIVAWKADDIISVECETDPTDKVISDKVNRYVRGTPMRECFVIPVNEMPTEMEEAYQWVANQL